MDHNLRTRRKPTTAQLSGLLQQVKLRQQIEDQDISMVNFNISDTIINYTLFKMIEYVFLFVIIFVVYFYYSYVYKPRKSYEYYIKIIQGLGYKVHKIPFKPLGVPFVQRYMESFTKHKDSFYFDKNLNQKYDFGIHNIMDQITIDLINPDMMREFLSMQKIFMFPKKKIYIANMKRLLGDGVAFSEGETWKLKRKIITSVFTFDFLKSIIPHISKVCDDQYSKAQEKWVAENPKSDQFQFFMLQVGFNIFSSILMISFFGMDSNKCRIEGKTPCEFITSALHMVNSQATEPLGYLLGPWIFNLGLKERDRKVNHIVKVFRQFASNLVKEKLEAIKEKNKVQPKENYADLIQALVYHYNLGSQNQGVEEKYNVDDVIDQFCTLLAAATDTTSHFFMMIVYYIVETPHVQERLRKQINQTFKTEQDFNYQNLKKMKYIDCIQEQVTRIYGPGTGLFLREATKDTHILDLPIKKGTSITIKPMPNHFDAQIFDQPLKFKPQRWQVPNNIHPYTIMGFSGGPRSCLGKHLTMLQTKIALIKLFKRFSSIQLQKHISEWQLSFKFLYTPQTFMTVLKH